MYIGGRQTGQGGGAGLNYFFRGKGKGVRGAFF